MDNEQQQKYCKTPLGNAEEKSEVFEQLSLDMKGVDNNSVTPKIYLDNFNVRNITIDDIGQLLWEGINDYQALRDYLAKLGFRLEITKEEEEDGLYYRGPSC